MKVKRKDLKTGHLTKELGLIISVDLEGADKFWGGKPNVHFIEWHDAYWGTVSAELRDDEYELVEDEERTEWLLLTRADIISRAKEIQADLQMIDSTITKDNKNGTND